MKKIIAFALSILTLMSVLTSCASISPNDKEKGAIIPVYFSSRVRTLDPMYAYLDDAGVKLLGLLYEGLFSVDEDGDIVNALCKSYTTGINREGDFYMEIKLNLTHWSDGRSVTADDFVFAWKRIIEPSSSSEAASMLFDIKNAKACKSGDASIDDFGAVATEPQILTITFEKEIDVEAFKKYLASPALVPLREDKVSRLKDWGSFYATIATNGPYYAKIFVPGEDSMILERSIYYYRDVESETQKLDKYVKPYRFKIYFCTADEALEMYNKGEIVYISELPLSAREEYKDKVTENETMSSATLYLNTTKAPFDNADVRKALSLAIDRNELVNIVKFASVSGGVVPSKVFDTKKGTSFRKEGGTLISASANMDEAKSLINSANVTVKDFTVTIREDETSNAVAEYVKKVWGELGFNVTIEAVGSKYHMDHDYDQYTDLFSKAYYDRDFDVILVDALATSVDAFSTLAPFAGAYSGASVDFSESTTVKPGVTGYMSSEYDAKIDAAYNESDSAKRASLLHEAEKLLMNDMPVIPLFVYKDAYLASDDFDDFSQNYYAVLNLNDATLDDYEDYQVYKDVYSPEEDTVAVDDSTAAE